MPNTVILGVGPFTSAPAVFATQSAQIVGDILMEFAVAEDGLGMPPESTQQQVLDACAKFAATRLRNYIINWMQNRDKKIATDAIDRGKPLDV